MDWFKILSDILEGIAIICTVAAVFMSFLTCVPVVVVLYYVATVGFLLSTHFESKYLERRDKK